MALKGDQARELAPRLTAAGLAGVRRVATSQITSGIGTSTEAVALDGIVYPVDTWTARSVPGLPTPASAAQRIDSAKGPGARLFAFGYDAWLLTGYLERLALSANADLQGTTGQLSLDGFGNVVRRPGWSRFSGGIATPVDDRAR
jgi:outer membrane PBP1 activator LpoA protein